MRVSIEKHISSLQISFNVPLKDSKYKTSRAFKMSPFSAIDYESLTHWSPELSRTGSLHLSDGSSGRVSEFAIHSDKLLVMLHGLKSDFLFGKKKYHCA